MRQPSSGGGWRSIAYAFRMARQAGGFWRFARALRTRNACKTCALGMGGQRGGMTNEAGRFPEVCKKSMQAMAADMRGRIPHEFFARYGFAHLRTLSPYDLERLGRVGQPLLAERGDAGYRPISWEEALRRCAAALRRTTPDESFFYFSGRASNEAAFLWQLFARLYGTNNVNNCSYYCHQASGVGLKSAFGTGTATVTLEDLERCDLVFLIGGNPASNHPRLMAELVRLRRRGGDVIVVNPLREVGLVNFRVPSDVRSMLFGSEVASLYLQPHIGGDIALLSGIAKRIDEMSMPCDEDRAFAESCENEEELRSHLLALDWDDIERRSGVPNEQIDAAADMYARSRAAIFAWTMGITHHVHGVDNVRAIANLALLRGMVGRPGAGLLPIRGHSNVQGVGSMGVAPQLAPAVLDRLQSHFGVRLPTTPGLDTLACVDAMAAGRMRTALCLGGNLYGATPDAARTAAAFEKLDFVAYLSTTLNTGHAWGRARETLILPVRARDEESQATTQESMFNYVRLSEGGPPRIAEARSETEIVAALARMVLPAGPLDWDALGDHARIREAIAAIVPGYDKIGQIDRTRGEFHVAGRTLHAPTFATPTGRAKFHVVPIPPGAAIDDAPLGPGAAGALRLMTIRSEGQFNTVVYEIEDVYRGQERRDVILMNPVDVSRLGLKPDERVTVRGEAGEMRDILVRPFDIRAGNAAMYCPEANVLVPQSADPESRTPRYKNVRVEIVPQQKAGTRPLPVAAARA